MLRIDDMVREQRVIYLVNRDCNRGRVLSLRTVIHLFYDGGKKDTCDITFYDVVAAYLLVAVQSKIDVVSGNRLFGYCLGTHLTAVVNQNCGDAVGSGKVRLTGLLNAVLADNACLAVSGSGTRGFQHLKLFRIDTADITDNM